MLKISPKDSRQEKANHALWAFADATFRTRVLRSILFLCCAQAFATILTLSGACAEPNDPILDLLLQKGIVTEAEVQKARTEAQRIRTNLMEMPPMESKWKLSKALKNIELFGDLRLRYEHREATTPINDRLELDRGRYAVRIGLRGEALDDFYYGLRLDTASNPRSPWVTFGSSSSGVPYNGPFGKSTSTIDIGQMYLGWRPTSWLDITVGKMANPLYSTAMVWDPDLNPEGAAERLKYTVGHADFFATFGQFLYQDVNPTYVSSGVLPTLLQGQKSDMPFLLAWQGGFNYHFTTNISAKVAASFYHYISIGNTNTASGFGDPFVGEGSYLGAGSATVNGFSGFPSGGAFGNFNGFAFNQTGLNHLSVLDFPFEVNFKIKRLSARVFGDFALNLEGNQRADAAFNQLKVLQAGSSQTPPLLTYGPQRNQDRAYQVGVAIGNRDSLGLVYGSTSRKHAWEFRTYWQHVEQYAVDPNLIDSDFFEGRANMEGIYAALAYGLSDNMTATARYGYAHRINDKLGTGGANQDIPQINPIDHYSLLQLDLTFRF
jgi:hypothetical protein